MSVRKSLAWNYSANLLVFAVTLAGMVVMSRLLTPYELGIFAVGMAVSGLLTALSYVGIANYLIRDHGLSPGMIATGFTINALLCMGVAALLWLIGALGVPYFAHPGIGRVLRWLSLVPVLGIFEFLPATLFTRNMQFATLSLLQLGKAVVNVAVMIIAALAGWSYLSPAIAALLGAAFGAVGFSIVGWRYVSFRLSLSGGAKILIFALQMIVAGGLPLVATRLSELIVSHQLGLGALGVYSRASGVAAMVWDGAYGLSTRVIYIKMATDLRETGSLKQTYLHSIKLLTVIMWPIMAGIAVLAGPIVHLLYGPQWSAAAMPLALLMAGQCIALGYALNWELCILANRTGWQARMEALRVVVGLALFTLGAMVSLAFAAASRVAEALFAYIIYRSKMSWLSTASTHEMREAYRGGGVPTLVAIAPAMALMVGTDWPKSLPIGHIALAIIVGVILWATFLMVTAHPLYVEARQILERRARDYRAYMG